MKKLRRLYKKTSTGATQIWEIKTDGNVIIETWGQIDGKMQETSDLVKEGKNVGKANETSPQEQAEAEAQSKWDKKIKKGYVEDVERAEAGETDHTGGIFPMLAKKFSEDGKKIKYPAYVQPKLDGHRCLADKEGVLWSRTRKIITGVPHITAEIKKLTAKGIELPAFLDGELYNHLYHGDFEKLSHFIRQETPEEGHEIIQYHVYDCVMEGGFRERISWLWQNMPPIYMDAERAKIIKLVETIEVADEDGAMEAFETFIKQGYEGAIIRNADGEYVNKRSGDLQKIKEFDDGEFKITGVEEGRGKLQGHAGKFICETQDGVEFRAKLKGELTRLKDYFENHKLWEGKQLTVQHQGWTIYKTPRFPVGLRIRED